MEGPILELEKVHKHFGSLEVLREISLQVKEGEFVSLLGPSGSGKSTLFRLITGLTPPDGGTIHIKQKPGKLPLAYMPQKDTLLPWKTMEENIALPLLISGVGKKEALARVQELLPVFGLEGFAAYYPGQLSGGMKQRAALMRTFLAGADLMLLDEPFAAVDAITRTDLQSWLLEVWQTQRRSVLFVTHSVEEAIYLSDRIYVLSGQPGSLVLDLPITLPRPRSGSDMTSPEFNQYRDVLYATLREHR